MVSAAGEAVLFHNITKRTARRGGVQVLEEEEKDVRLLDRLQDLEDKSWRHEELRSLEEGGLPRMKEEKLKKAARSYKAAAGVGCDGFHPKVPLDLSGETRG